MRPHLEIDDRSVGLSTTQSPFHGDGSNGLSTTLEDRLILVLREAGEVYGMWQRLEELTGSLLRAGEAYGSYQRPTPDMVQALCRQRPEYAFWLATGITDAENGHKAPTSALPFPEWRAEGDGDQAAIDYFKASLDLLDNLAVHAGLQEGGQAERPEAFGRRRMRRHWWASPLAGVAAELAEQNPAYEELKQLRNRGAALRSVQNRRHGKVQIARRLGVRPQRSGPIR